MENLVLDRKTGVVQQPHVHDATLVGISVLADATELKFRTPAGRIARVVLHHVRGLVINSFYETNILFEIRVTPAAEATDDELCAILHLAMKDPRADSRWKKLGIEQLVVVRFEPSLGAEILAMCRSVTWTFEETGLH